MAGSLLLVDAASLYFRAFYAISPETVTAADGTPVNAVRGFTDLLAALVRARRPGRMVCALDADWRPAWRVDLLPSYKTHRLASDGEEAAPDLLAGQVPIIVDLLAAFGIPAVGVAGFEADDVIGTLAVRELGPIDVATGDRDLFQVIDDQRAVRVLYCARGVARMEVIDDAAVVTRYGVPARWYGDLATLRGDPSDGLPGVPGIGVKTAAALLKRFAGLDGVLAAVSDLRAPLTPAVRTRLAGAVDYLHRARQVVALRLDVPVPAGDLTLPPAPIAADRLLELVGRWNLAGPARRLAEAIASVAVIDDLVPERE
jgi:5'-3' exonuclease